MKVRLLSGGPWHIYYESGSLASTVITRCTGYAWHLLPRLPTNPLLCSRVSKSQAPPTNSLRLLLLAPSVPRIQFPCSLWSKKLQSPLPPAQHAFSPTVINGCLTCPRAAGMFRGRLRSVVNWQKPSRVLRAVIRWVVRTGVRRAVLPASAPPTEPQRSVLIESLLVSFRNLLRYAGDCGVSVKTTHLPPLPFQKTIAAQVIGFPRCFAGG